MGIELPKIEATLHQLADKSTDRGSEPSSPGNQPQVSPQDAAIQKRLSSPLDSLKAQPSSVQQTSAKKTPALPKFRRPNDSIPQQRPNPSLAMNLLQEMQTIVGQWQAELQQLLRQIQDIYLEGPIIEGWLESGSSPTPTGKAKESPELLNPWKDLGVDQYKQATPNPNRSIPSTGYRLCSIDEQGRLWSRTCPPEELPSVSVAIARYQRLKQLLERKQELENRLTQLAKTFTVLQGQLQTFCQNDSMKQSQPSQL